MLRLKGKHAQMIVLLAILVMAFFAMQSQAPEALKVPPNPQLIYDNAETLASEAYEGRLTGSSGNEKAIQFVMEQFNAMGIESFKQTFTTIVPDVDCDPIFNIGAQTSFELYKDYTVLTYGNGGGIDFKGELIIVGSDLMRTPSEQIEGRLVLVDAGRVLPDWVRYVQANGGKGLLCSADTQIFGKPAAYELQKSVSIGGKTGETLLVGYVSNRMFKAISEQVSEQASQEAQYSVVSDVTLKVDISFPVVETSNVFGVIKGEDLSDKVLIISAGLDGLGMGADGKVFPGAASEASSVSVLLETARILSKVQSSPWQTIVFALWNGQHQDESGSEYYLSHPLYTLDKTKLMHVEAVGVSSLEGLTIKSMASTLMADHVYDYATDQGLLVQKAPLFGGVGSRFADHESQVVVLRDVDDNHFAEGTYGDAINTIDPDVLKRSAHVIVSYVSKMMYDYSLFDYVNPVVWLLLAVITIGGLLSTRLKRLYSKLLPYPILVVLLALLVNIRQTTEAKMVQGELTTNFSLYLTLKRTYGFISELLTIEFYQSDFFKETLNVVKSASWMSVKLVAVALTMALTLGTIRGLFESYRQKPFSMRTLGSLFIFSIPDVFVVLLGLLGYTLLFRQFPVLGEYPWIKGFILPATVLAIIPSIYVSRITAVAVHEELGKDYVRAAKALGYSRRHIFTSELLPAVIRKIIESLPTLTTMLLSNMIVVEYLFNYNGMGYYLLFLYKRQDTVRFVTMALALGAIYVIFAKGVKRR